MPFKIRSKLIVAFMALISAILILTGLVGYYNISASDRAIHKVEAIAEEIIVIGDLHQSLEHALMPANDYLITGDRKYIDDFNVSSKRLEEAFKKTDELLGNLEAFGLPQIGEERKTLKDIKTAWLNIKELSLKILSIPNPVGSKDGVMMMEEMDYRWGGRITELIHKWQKGEVEEYEEAVEMAEKARRMSWVIFGSADVLLLILCAGFAVLYSRSFVGPIEKLHNDADAIAGGDFKSRVDVKTGDELEQLANAMNEMAEKLDSFYGTLENQVMARTRDLRESEEKYRTMIENSNDMIWTLAPDTRFTFINRQAEEVTGHSREEWLGKTFAPLVPEEELPMVFDIHNKIMSGEKAHYEVRGKKRDGGIIILSVNAAPILKDSKVTGTISFGRDITEQKKAEETLRESEEQFRNLLEQMPNMVFINKKGRVVYANAKCEEIMKYKKEEFYSPDFDFLTLIAPEYVELVKEKFEKHKKGEEVGSYEYAIVTKDGKRIDALLNTIIIRYEGEKSILGINTDITELKKAEEKIKEQLDYLERFQKVAVKREFRIKDLVDEVEKLKAEIEGLKKRNT